MVGWSTGRGERGLRAAHAAMPCLIAVPVLIGIVSTLADLVTTAHPHLGWTQTNASDIKAVALGHSLYADPAGSYTGMLYTPGFSFLVAPLYLLVWWDGWPALVAMLSGVGLAVLVGAVAVREGANRVVAAVAMLGSGGLGWWLVSIPERNVLLDAYSDQTAWLLVFAGLALLARSASTGSETVWPSVLLLSAAVWTKQTAAAGLLTGVVVLWLWARWGVVATAVWRRFLIGALVLNGTAGIALLVATDGWAWRFTVELPARHATVSSFGDVAAQMIAVLLVPSLLLLVCGGALALESRAVRWWTLRTFVALFATVLVVFLAVAIGPAWLARRKQGGDTNHYVGILWASAFLLALVHRSAVRSRAAMLAGVLAYGLLALLVLPASIRGAAVDRGVELATPTPQREIAELPAALLGYAEDHEVYVASYGALGPGDPLMAPEPNLWDLLAAGMTPDVFVEALLERRFDAVTLLTDEHEHRNYIAAAGRTDSSYLSDLNALIRAGYEPGANGAPPGLLGRREALELSEVPMRFRTTGSERRLP